MKIQLIHGFEKIVGIENLLEAWSEFANGKRNKRDVQEFSLHLMDNIFSLHNDLIHHIYRHGVYQAFNISDPKPRNIHKASARDRLVHHAIHRALYPFFNNVFTADSFSCRIDKGTHAATNRFRAFARIVSKNNTHTSWVLKCDIRKFFTSINHGILIEILKYYVPDRDIVWLLEEVIGSFSSATPDVGLPLGNLTSQLFANIYMNEFDQFVKHKLKARYYIRYADDFVFLSENRERLVRQIIPIRKFLHEKLKLDLHEAKIIVKTLASGVDFLGWVHFPDHRVLRTATRRRMMKRIYDARTDATINSYLGLVKHGNARKLRSEILSSYDFSKT